MSCFTSWEGYLDIGQVKFAICFVHAFSEIYFLGKGLKHKDLKSLGSVFASFGVPDILVTDMRPNLSWNLHHVFC